MAPVKACRTVHSFQVTSTPNLSKFLSSTPILMSTLPVACVLSRCLCSLLKMGSSDLNSGPPPRKKAKEADSKGIGREGESEGEG